MEDKYEKITDDLIMFMPLFRRAFLKANEDDKCVDLSKSQYPILGRLTLRGDQTMSELCTNLGIMKSNMTSIIDNLVKDGKVIRTYEENDRRIIKIKITEKGKKTLFEAKSKMKEEFKNRLSLLEKNDFDKLSKDLSNIKNILSKINSIQDKK